MVSEKLKQTAVIMTAIFTVLMLVGFIGVYAVDYEWKQNFPEGQLFITDQDITFPVVPYGDGWVDPYYADLQSCQREFTTPDYQQYNRSVVYTGNNTYSMSVNTTAGTSNSAIMVIDLPNIDNWVISNIKLNSTVNGDADGTLKIDITHYDGIEINFADVKNTVFEDTSIGTSDYYADEDIALAKALGVNNAAQNTEKSVMRIIYQDEAGDGLSNFAWVIKLEITGQKLSEVSISDTVAWVIGGSCVLNILAILYMTDSIDIIPSKDAKRYRKGGGIGAFFPLAGVGLFGLEMSDLAFDMLYFLPIMILVLAGLLTYYKRLTIPTAIMSVLIALGITVMFAPYQAIILTPLINALWYGYSWTIPSYLPVLGLIHVTTLFIMGLLAVYNLYKTHGKSLWL